MSTNNRFDNLKYVTGNYTIDFKYGIVLCDTSVRAITITLPDIQQSGLFGQPDNWIMIVDNGGNAGVNPITITRSGNNTIDGANSVVINTNSASILFIPTTYTTWSSVGSGSGSGNSIVQITRQDLIDLRDASRLVAGTIYEVTNPASSGTENNFLLDVVRLVAADSSSFQQYGSGLFWYGNYQLDSAPILRITNIWIAQSDMNASFDVMPPIQAGDVRIALNARWINLTGVNTDAAPYQDAVNWEGLTPSEANGYVQRWNEVAYDLDLDLIIYRKEYFVFDNYVAASPLTAIVISNESHFDAVIYSIAGYNNINLSAWGIGVGCVHNGGALFFQSRYVPFKINTNLLSLVILSGHALCFSLTVSTGANCEFYGVCSISLVNMIAISIEATGDRNAIAQADAIVMSSALFSGNADDTSVYIDGKVSMEFFELTTFTGSTIYFMGETDELDLDGSKIYLPRNALSPSDNYVFAHNPNKAFYYAEKQCTQNETSFEACIIDLQAPAYNALTTYFFGDCVTSGGIVYMWIANDSGNVAIPNVGWWSAVYDSGTSALSIPFEAQYSNIRLENTGTIDLILNTVEDFNQKITAYGNTANITINGVARASLVVAGETAMTSISSLTPTITLTYDGFIGDWIVIQKQQGSLFNKEIQRQIYH